MIGKLLKFLVILAFFGLIGLVGYAYLGDLTPETQPVEAPVTLNVD